MSESVDLQGLLAIDVEAELRKLAAAQLGPERTGRRLEASARAAVHEAASRGRSA